MKNRLRRAITCLTLTAALATGVGLITDLIAHPAGDTTWGAPDTGDDTRWATQPTNTSEPALPDLDDSPITITLLDTTWG